MRMMAEHCNPPEEGARCSKRKRNVGWSTGERFGSCANETQKLFAGSSSRERDVVTGSAVRTGGPCSAME